MLFKVDSTNDVFMNLIGMPIDRDRTKYIDALESIGILDEYPMAVVNMAIYAFASANCLGYLKKLDKTDGGFVLV